MKKLYKNILLLIIILLILYLINDITSCKSVEKFTDKKMAGVYVVEWGIYGRKFSPSNLEEAIKSGKINTIYYAFLNVSPPPSNVGEQGHSKCNNHTSNWITTHRAYTTSIHDCWGGSLY